MENLNIVNGEGVDSQNSDYQEPKDMLFNPENAKIIVEKHIVYLTGIR